MPGHIYTGDHGKPVSSANPLPVQTAGGSVVSVSEEFWSRISRYGRYKQISITGMNIGNTGSWESVTGTTVTINNGYLFYVKEVLLSASIDCELAIKVESGYRVFDLQLNPQRDNVNDYTPGFYASFVKGFTPHLMKFDGSVWVDADIGGKMSIESRSTTPAGKFTGYIVGYEVAKNA